MAYPAENLDFEDPSKEQLKQLQDGESGTAAVVEINDLRSRIGDKIARAEDEGVINRTDADRLRLGLQKSEKNKQEVFRMGSEVNKVIEESKQLMSVIDDKGELALFKEMSLEEKRDYVSSLRKQAENLNARADKLAQFLPDAKEKLKTLKGADRVRFIEELNVRRGNLTSYSGKLKKYEKHFSAETQGEFMEQFAECSLSDQAKWLEVFEKDYAVPRESLSMRYEALPAKYRERIRDFYNLRRRDKDKMVEKTEEEYKFDRAIDDNPDSRYMSVDSREFAKKSFMGAPAALRRDMKTMLENHMKKEAALGRRFEDLPGQVRERYPNFKELEFEKKEEILKKENVIEKGGEPEAGREKAEVLTKKYEKMLRKELDEKAINLENFNDYMDWIRKQPVKAKDQAMTTEKFDGEQMNWRRKCRDDFRKLPPGIQQANQDFYSLKGHARMERLAKLLEREEGNNGMPAKAVKPAAGVTGEAIPGNDNALDQEQVRARLKRVKESGTVKKKIRRKNVAEGLAKLAVSSDMINQGVYESKRKDQHLHGEKEKRVNEKLVQFTGGKMVADSGDNKAKKIKNVDLDRLEEGAATEDEVLDLKREVTSNQGEKAKNVYHIQFADRKSGRNLTGAMGRQKVREQDKSLHEDIAEEVAAGMEADGGKLSREDKEKLRKIVDEDKLKIELREAA